MTYNEGNENSKVGKLMQKKKADVKYLSKDEELALGKVIQAHYKAAEELSSGKRITPKKKEKLEQEVAAGENAVRALVEANIGLVYDRARVFKSRYPAAPELEDLVQEGMTGLMTAIKKYDPARGNKFSTVAYYWIVQAVARGANKTGRLVRLPENRINDYTSMTAILNSEEADGLSTLELDNLIMDKLGISKNDLLNIRAAAATPASLNKVVSRENGSTRELMDYVGEDNKAASSEESVIRDEMHSALMDAIQELSPVKRDVIKVSFSLTDTDANVSTIEDIREIYGIHPAKMKRLQMEAVKELKAILTKSGFSSYDFAEMM